MLSTRLAWFLSSLIIKVFLKNVEAKLTGEQIVGADLAEESQFPYQAFVYYSKDLNYKCGGAILDEKHVITAAHCVIDRHGFFETVVKVKVGIIDGTKCTEDFLVERIYLPWAYAPRDSNGKFNLTYDIAVLKLSENLDLSPASKLRAVKLPEKKESRNNETNKSEWFYSTYTGKKAILSGYGMNHMRVFREGNDGKLIEDGSSDHQLRYAESIVLSHSECTKLTKAESTHTFCASMTPRENTHRGACAADSGGPLVYNDTLIGILVSSPLGCSEKKRPARYTRVSKFVSFINNAINEIDLSKMRVAELTVQYQLVDASEDSELAKNYWNPDL